MHIPPHAKVQIGDKERLSVNLTPVGNEELAEAEESGESVEEQIHEEAEGTEGTPEDEAEDAEAEETPEFPDTFDETPKEEDTKEASGSDNFVMNDEVEDGGKKIEVPRLAAAHARWASRKAKQ